MNTLPTEIKDYIFSLVDPIMVPLSLYCVNYKFNEISKKYCAKKYTHQDLQKYLISCLNNNNNINDFEFITKFGIDVNYDEICNYSSSCGNLDCLQYAHENVCDWAIVT